MNLQKTGFFLLVLFLSVIVISPAVSAAVDGSTWTQATASAPWSARSEFGTTVFNNRMWVIGGTETGTVTPKNDVWTSTDGITWSQATSAAQWTGRNRFTTVTFNNKLWVLGGNPNGNLLNDVWSSADGITWTQATANAAWPVRYDHTSTVFNNKMWVIAGTDNTGANWNDVWSSTDGTTWTRATANAPWSVRRGTGVVTFNGKMWVIGGLDSFGSFLNDVWSSPDGITWTQATANAGWSPRYQPRIEVYDNKMWVLGTNGQSDIWSSSDGITWSQVTASAAFPVRNGYRSVAFNDTMWILGGYNRNDVWYATNPPAPMAAFSGTPTSGNAPLSVQFTDGSTNTPTGWAWDFNNDGTTDSTAQNPSYTFNTAGTYSVKLSVTNVGGTNSLSKTSYIIVNAPASAPVAAFSGTPTSGTAPLAVQFTDASTGSPTSWAWDFNNDGTTDSIVQNPAHTYDAIGSYTVKLTVTSAGGSNWTTHTNYVIVTNPSGTTLSFRPGNVTAMKGTTTDFAIVLNNAPQGLSGYNITVATGNSTIGTITGVTYPSWATPHMNSTLPSGSVWIKAVDISGTAGSTNITLCTVSVFGATAGTSNLIIQSNRIDDLAGARYTPSVVSGSFTVIEVLTLPGHALPPTDPDHDGIFEDLNGNGYSDFADVVEYFNHMEWINSYEPIALFDLNGNGSIDFEDLVRLFEEIG